MKKHGRSLVALAIVNDVADTQESIRIDSAEPRLRQRVTQDDRFNIETGIN